MAICQWILTISSSIESSKQYSFSDVDTKSMEVCKLAEYSQVYDQSGGWVCNHDIDHNKEE